MRGRDGHPDAPKAALDGHPPEHMPVIDADDVAAVVVDLVVASDRTGESVGVWPGHEVWLPRPTSPRSRPT